MWIGYSPLSGDVMWNPEDVEAPSALIFDPRRWKGIEHQEAPRFRGWRYLDPPFRQLQGTSEGPSGRLEPRKSLENIPIASAMSRRPSRLKSAAVRHLGSSR
ncbi:MAG: hypothetical protein ACRD2T_15770, partial [Thermoanaerobaculia bacterium]